MEETDGLFLRFARLNQFLDRDWVLAFEECSQQSPALSDGYRVEEIVSRTHLTCG